MRARIGAVALAAVLLAGAALVPSGSAGAQGFPARSGPGPVTSAFNSYFTKYPASINGDYQKVLTGYLGCGTGSGPFIFFYAPGSATEYLWTNLEADPPMDPQGLLHDTRAYSVTGTYTPIVGDFDGDSCDDIFWYAPGTAQDSVWYLNGDGSVKAKKNVTVNGTYRPVSGHYSGDDAADILWYAPGTAKDSMWLGTSTLGSFTPSTVPAINGDYRPVASDSTVWFYAPGAAQDYVWRDLAPAIGPADVKPITLASPNYQLAAAQNGLVAYAPGSEADKLLVLNMDGSITTEPGTINGTYRMSTDAHLIVFHGPGSAPDAIWQLQD